MLRVSQQEQGEVSVVRYRKKPIVIEAVQWLNEKIVCPPGPLWFTEAEERGQIRLVGRTLLISTPEGVMEAVCGDWIIQGIAGELYPCKPSIFEATYEKAE